MSDNSKAGVQVQVPGVGIHGLADKAMDLAALRPAGEPISLSVSRGPARAPRGNVVSGETFEREVSRSLKAIADIAAGTLGPHGRHAIVLSREGDHHPTKDGHSVIKQLTFAEPIPNMVLDTVRSITRQIVARVGDGSTSSVVTADNLYRALQKRDLTRRYPAGSVAAAINGVAQSLGERVRSRAVKIESGEESQELLARVAAVSANNDPQLGEMVASLYKDTRNLRVSVREGDSRQSETTVEISTGFRCGFGYFHDLMANVNSATGAPGRVEFAEASVAIFAEELKASDASFLIPLIQSHANQGRPLVIVAVGFSPEVQGLVLGPFRNNRPYPIALVDHAFTASRHRHALEDLALYVGATVVNSDTCPRTASPEPAAYTPDEAASIELILGRANSVTMQKSETLFQREDVPEVVSQVIAELEAAVFDVESTNDSGAGSDSVAELRNRLLAITGRSAIVLAGGESRQERTALRDLLEDAALACEAALKEGISEGLGLPVIWSLSHAGEAVALRAAAICGPKSRLPADRAREVCREVTDAFRDAYEATVRRVLGNSYVRDQDAVIDHCVSAEVGFDLITGTFGETGKIVIPVPTLTDSEILLGVASVVSLLVTSDQAVMLTAPDAAVSEGV